MQTRSQTCFGIDYVSPSTAWADILRGPPAAASLAHTAKILAWNAARTAKAAPSAGGNSRKDAASPPTMRAA